MGNTKQNKRPFSDYIEALHKFYTKQLVKEQDEFIRKLIPKFKWEELIEEDLVSPVLWKGVYVSDKEELMSTNYKPNDFETLDAVRCDNCGGILAIKENYYSNKRNGQRWCANCYVKALQTVQGNYKRVVTEKDDYHEYCAINNCYKEQEYIVSLIFDEHWTIDRRACALHVYDNKIFSEESED